MRIDVTNAFYVQFAAFNKFKNLFAGRDHRHGQIPQQPQDQDTVSQAAASNFTQHKGVHENSALFEQLGELRVSGAEMINPDRGVNEDQVEASRRLRGAAFSWA